MGDKLINGVLISPEKVVPVPGGEVLRGIRSDAAGYCGFGEAYFSTVVEGMVKGWKRHRRMTMNLLVPKGRVRFVLFDDRADSSTFGGFQTVVLSPERYRRLTVPPMIWVAFQGLSEEASLLLNVADIIHDPGEVDRRVLSDLLFDWSSGG